MYFFFSFCVFTCLHNLKSTVKFALKTFTKDKAIYCSHCKDNHKTCIKSAGSVELLYNNYLCQPCAHFTFPFHSIDDTELLEIFEPKIPLNASIFNQLFIDIEPRDN